MKLPGLFLFSCLLLAPLAGLHAQTNNSPDIVGTMLGTLDPAELIQAKINTKVKAGLRSEADLAPEIKQIDENIKARAANKEVAGRLAFLKALVYADVIHDPVKARDLVRAVQRDYPGTEAAHNAADISREIEMLARRAILAPELQALEEQIMDRIDAGTASEAAQKQEIAQFNALGAKYAGKPAAAAEVALSRAMYHLMALQQPREAREMLMALREKYPATGAADDAKAVLEKLNETASR